MSERQIDLAEALVRKLEHFVSFSKYDVEKLRRLGQSEEQFGRHHDIVRDGQIPRSAFVIIEGLAYRYRLLPDGRRQIMTFLMPGDLCDLHVFLLRRMDHSIGCVTPVRLASVSRDDILEMTISNPRLSLALWWSALQEEAMLRERIVALGRRNATERVAYLLCELVWRHKAIARNDGDRISLPLTQTEIADTLGLTAVHVNRILQGFRKSQLVKFEHRTLTLFSISKLAELAEFDDSYLHLGPAPSDIMRYFTERERDKPQ
jgi:CRP-like cAMP-binding protein